MFDKEVYIARRKALLERLAGQKGIVLFLGNVEAPAQYKDNCYKWRQDSNWLYFFGIDEPRFAATIDLESGEETVYADDFSIDDIIWMGPMPTVRSLADAAGIQAIEICGIAGEAGQELQHGQISRLYEVFQSQRESGLETDHSAGGFCEVLLCLLMVCVGGVIGGDQIDRTVREAGNDCPAVCLCAQGRIDLGQSAAAEDSFLCQREVMRCRFRVNAGVQLSGIADEFHAFCCGDVLDTERGTGLYSKIHVSADQGDLRFAGRTGKIQGLSCSSSSVDPVLGDEVFVLFMKADR